MVGNAKDDWIAPGNDIDALAFTHGLYECLRESIRNLRWTRRGREEKAEVPAVPNGPQRGSASCWNAFAWEPLRIFLPVADKQQVRLGVASGRINSPEVHRETDFGNTRVANIHSNPDTDNTTGATATDSSTRRTDATAEADATQATDPHSDPDNAKANAARAKTKTRATNARKPEPNRADSYHAGTANPVRGPLLRVSELPYSNGVRRLQQAP